MAGGQRAEVSARVIGPRPVLRDVYQPQALLGAWIEDGRGQCAAVQRVERHLEREDSRRADVVAVPLRQLLVILFERGRLSG